MSHQAEAAAVVSDGSDGTGGPVAVYALDGNGEGNAGGGGGMATAGLTATSHWLPILTNTFDANVSFTVMNVFPGASQCFFLLLSQ